MVNLNTIGVPAGQRHPRKRVGRGMGSGHGKTSTRGHKGQMSRSGTRHKRGFEGGQMPLQRRLPKRGFHNIFRKRFAIINLKQIAKLDETVISPEILLASGVVKSLHDGLKILGDGDLAKAVTVSAHYFSQSARDKILKAGGKVEVLAE
ncbi:MAG: 50S ribosomal protein L15 [Acidobacteria bacterium RIFCSPLOWO2_02_FULL_60_20]|nr:MAG: 50S ribosomal protein L15 [Acidobacteria bacterium RIFCSPLOWO2_02_FULL_60_20]OFW45434.1 MAG: 50S ribosomal protein L15 [Acidobacteria bacterium RIFCSPLOWO2_12_FULL_60_22]